MKKVFLTFALMLTAMAASAQFYVGGGVGYSKTESGNNEATVFSITPEVGYVINEDWSVGATLGFENVEDVSKTFTVEPYVRYTLCQLYGISSCS